MEFLTELQKTHDINRFFSRLPLSPETFPRIEFLSLLHTDFSLDILAKDLQSSESNYYQQKFLDTYTQKLPLILLLVRGYTAKGSYTEVILVFSDVLQEKLGHGGSASSFPQASAPNSPVSASD